MPFKMIALRTLYHPDDRRDYKAGQEFTVKSEKERDRLVRALRARVDEPTKASGIKSMKRPDPAPVAAPTPAPEPEIVQKVETPAADDALPNPFPASEPAAAPTRPGRYRRADMKAED
jgi:hypothetical protein